METFINWIGSILAILIILWIVSANIVRLVMWTKCFKIKECNNRKCSIRNMCHKYHEKITEEDRQRIMHIIAKIK